MDNGTNGKRRKWGVLAEGVAGGIAVMAACLSIAGAVLIGTEAYQAG